MTRSALAALVLLTSCQASVDEQADPLRVEQLAATCQSCHPSRTSARSAGPADVIVALDGRPYEVISQALWDYRENRRVGALMNGIARGLSAPQIDSLSQLFADRSPETLGISPLEPHAGAPGNR